MIKVIWKSKKCAWNWLAITTGKTDVLWYWRSGINWGYHQWYAYIHTPFLTFSKNNCEWKVGIAFGRYYIALLKHF